MWSPEQLLALVALINACGGVIALVIHALRVPYRESAAKEQVAAADSILKFRASRAGEPPPPPPAA